MSMSQLPQETMRGFSPPTVRQFSVFLDNRVGKLLDLVRAFDEAPDVTLHGLNVLESSDHAIVRLIPDNADAARHLLKAYCAAFSEVDLLVLELTEDCTISTMCFYLLGAELNILFLYPLMDHHGTAQGARVALAVDDSTLAGQILMRKHFRLLGERDLM